MLRDASAASRAEDRVTLRDMSASAHGSIVKLPRLRSDRDEFEACRQVVDGEYAARRTGARTHLREVVGAPEVFNSGAGC